MQRYKSHKVVEAGRIMGLSWEPTSRYVNVESDNERGYERIEVTAEFYARGTPGLKDYLVRHEPDGYLSWSPADKFEAGYTLVNEESNMERYAKEELKRLRGPADEPDEMQDAIEANVLGIVREFSDAGHSGSSGAYTIGIIQKLLDFEPLTPLTGEDDEWTDLDYDDDMKAQNKRCPHVFKRADGTAYDSQAIVKRWPNDGGCTVGGRKEITFPYTPSREYVDVDENGEPVVAPEVQQRADILLALEAALVLLGRNEPGDSRAVSNQFVAMGAALAGRTSEGGRKIMREIIAQGKRIADDPQQVTG